ncbi:MAG: MarR family transcriptional regulator [Pseudomonadota bacterium]
MAGAPPDHVGIDLVRAADRWERLFKERMVAAGFPVIAEARGRLIRFVGREGILQADLVSAAGMSKQAVQKHLVALEADGLIWRDAVGSDRRARKIRFTEAGRRMIAAGDRIKGEIEVDLMRDVGPQAFRAFRQVLKSLGENGQQD